MKNTGIQFGDFTYHVDATFVMHREDGPAIKHPTHQEWFKNVNGQPRCHRSDGPARIFKVAPDGQKFVAEWWTEGTFILSAVLSEEVFMQYWEE